MRRDELHQQRFELLPPKYQLLFDAFWHAFLRAVGCAFERAFGCAFLGVGWQRGWSSWLSRLSSCLLRALSVRDATRFAGNKPSTATEALKWSCGTISVTPQRGRGIPATT